MQNKKLSYVALGALLLPSTLFAKAKPANEDIRHQAAELRAAQPHLQQTLKMQAADLGVKKVLAHSQSQGNYYIVSDLHMGLGRERADGPSDRQEDFHRSEVFIKTVQQLAKQPGKNTLVVSGDFIDILEHANPEDSNDKVKAAISQMVKGHAAEFKALAHAIVKDDLRLVYNRGNHDIRLVDATETGERGKKILREHFIDEIAKVSELNARDTATMKARIGFTGHAAPLGKFGQVLVFHGDQTDTANSWRDPANPFSYKKNGARVIPRNFGDNVVREEWVPAERDNPDGDNGAMSSTKAVAENILKNAKTRRGAMQLLQNVSRHRIDSGSAQKLAEKIDDRETKLNWVKQTGIADMLNRPIHAGDTPRKMSPQQYEKIFEQIYAAMPTPVQERMTSRFHLVNALRIAFSGKMLLGETAQSEPRFLQLITEKLPNVQFVVAGHDHYERGRIGQVSGKGDVGFYDSGTWTRMNNEDRLDVVVVKTDTAGLVVGTPQLFRADQTTGAPTVVPHMFEEQTAVPGWSGRNADTVRANGAPPGL